MFVLPPPPRYIGPTGGSTPTIIETYNTLDHPTGPELNLIVGEGTYALRDELHLAAPPPPPSEAPQAQPPNPLATQIQPPTAGTKISLAITSNKHSSQYWSARTDTPNSNGSGPLSNRESFQESNRDSNNGSLFRNTAFGNLDMPSAPLFGASNPALSMAGATATGKDTKESTKRRKPKNNIVKSNSSFVSRVAPHENLSKRLAEHNPEGPFAFANIGRSIQWLDFTVTLKAEILTKILFSKAHALCHHVNEVSKGPGHIDIVMGFSTGDIVWYEPMSQKYARLNKNNTMNATAIPYIQWIPGSESLFMAAHSDGHLIVYDKEKEDAAIPPEELIPSPEHEGPGKAPPYLQIKKSWQSQNQKTNPVAVWKVSNQKINGFALSPNGVHLAIASEDGCLRIIDIHQEKLLDVFPSYYGGMRSVCWSPDGRYILTGGQDDLISIWSMADSALVARCQGHHSWVSAVAFDPWRCDERNYRFGSVGEDGRLLLWDFSHGMLHRPRAASVRQRASISSAVPINRHRAESSASRLHPSDHPNIPEHEDPDYDDIVHPVQGRGRVAVLPPVMAKEVDNHPLCWLTFMEDCIMTSCSGGHVKTWDRPKDGAVGVGQANPGSTGLGSARGKAQ